MWYVCLRRLYMSYMYSARMSTYDWISELRKSGFS